MTSLAWTSPSPDEVPFHCRVCRRALHRHHNGNGVVTFLHPAEVRGGRVEHQAQPAPVTEVPDPIIECDFCSRPGAAWVYVCADQETETRIVTARTVARGDYQRRHHAARTLHVETTRGPLQIWGERWSACDGCATLVEDRDLYALISRVTEAMPAAYTRGKKLMKVRGQLHGTYGTVLDSLRPGRAGITPQHPMGLWTSPQPDEANADTDRTPESS